LEAGAYRIVDTCGVRSVRRTVVLVEREDTLLRDLEAFVGEHGRCGELDGGVEGETREHQRGRVRRRVNSEPTAPPRIAATIITRFSILRRTLPSRNLTRSRI